MLRVLEPGGDQLQLSVRNRLHKRQERISASTRSVLQQAQLHDRIATATAGFACAATAAVALTPAAAVAVAPAAVAALIPAAALTVRV